MAILGVDDFKAKLTGGGARPNLFKVTLGFPTGVTANVADASFMIKAASLPASQIGTVPLPFRGRILQLAGDRIFDPWSITVVNDTNFDVRNSFEQWMNLINQHELNTGVTNPTAYMADMVVEQLDKDGSVIKYYDMRGTWPSNLGAIELSMDTGDTVEEFTVELQVQYWESNKTT
jgi:hypothetical protein